MIWLRVHTLTLCAMWSFALVNARSFAQSDDPATIAARLTAAGTKARLETPSTPAYHLQAKFETFDIAGKPDGVGSLDAYWDGKERSQRTETYRGATRINIRNHGLQTSGESSPTSASERELLRGLFEPTPPEPRLLQDDELTQKTTSISGTSMDCVTVKAKAQASSPNQTNSYRPPSYPTVYCVNPASGTLRIADYPGGMALVYNRLELFGGKSIAREMTITQGKILRAKMEVTSLAPWQPDDRVFVPPAGSVRSTDDQQVAPLLMANLAISKTTPVYPILAKQNHVSGIVLLQALISKEGTVHDLEVLSSPMPALSESAMDAVKDWKYKPYLINGEPTEVELTVGVTYSFATR